LDEAEKDFTDPEKLFSAFASHFSSYAKYLSEPASDLSDLENELSSPPNHFSVLASHSSELATDLDEPAEQFSALTFIGEVGPNGSVGIVAGDFSFAELLVTGFHDAFPMGACVVFFMHADGFVSKHALFAFPNSVEIRS